MPDPRFTSNMQVGSLLQALANLGLELQDIDTLKTTIYNDLPVSSLNAAGIVQLSSATNSESTTTAANSKAVYDVQQALNTLQTNLASTYATKNELSAIPKFSIEIVDTLPVANDDPEQGDIVEISETTVYLLRDTNGTTGNLYTEYLYVNGNWEILGSAYVDLSNYVQVTDLATSSANGLMSSTDKSKLDAIEAGANNYTHPTTSGNKHIPTGGSSGQILRWAADGEAAWGNDTDTTYGVATSSTNGLMSAADKAKLDTMDSVLDATLEIVDGSTYTISNPDSTVWNTVFTVSN